MPLDLATVGDLEKSSFGGVVQAKNLWKQIKDRKGGKKTGIVRQTL